MPSSTRVLRIGVDTGGTFTDVLAVCPDGSSDRRRGGNRLRAIKLPSTPADPAQAVLRAIAYLLPADQGAGPGAGPLDGVPQSLEPMGVECSGGVTLPAHSGPVPLAPSEGRSAVESLEVIHGTTVGTNAILERRGARTAFCTTLGFRDLLILGRQSRPSLYALHPQMPPPLCPEDLCVEVDERMDARGTPLRVPTEAELGALPEKLRSLGVESIAVVFLHSYAQSSHEELVEKALLPLGLPVSLSSVVLPAHREYERAMATVADAYVAPVVGGYLRRLSEGLLHHPSALPSRLRVMQSTGGAIAASEAAAVPVRTVLSGPAAGVIGAQAVAHACGEKKVITFDMGGTSTDVALLTGDGEPALTSEAQIAGLPLCLPMLSVHTVGAGGGSLVRVDLGKALRVGPTSAGADPGPAAYGKGGTSATLTDADLLLGRLWPGRFCDGAIPLSADAARKALEPIGNQLGLSVLTTAAGVIEVATALVARAIRTITVDRGEDPAEFTLLPFGGAGALHAADLARELGISRILVPPAPGLLSAYGALCAKVVRERARTLLVEASGAQQQGLVKQTLRELRAQVQQDLEREGAGNRQVHLNWSVDMRYHGQSYELTLPGVGEGAPEAGPETDLVVRFHQAHEKRYQFTLAERRVDLVALRVRGVLLAPEVPPALLLRLGRQSSGIQREPLIGTAETTFVEEGVLRTYTTPVFDRAALPPGQAFLGPALITEYSATTVVPPDWGGVVNDYGALLLQKR